jgi:hypothetical protein
VLNVDEIKEIKKNLFRMVADLVTEQPDFPWHRDRYGITTIRSNSSQALAVSMFGTIRQLASRDSIVNQWSKKLNLDMKGPWKISLEETVDKKLLNETMPTQIDAVAKGVDGIILFECKFTEPDGGSCSQPQVLDKGRHKGTRQCNGNYEQQINPVNSVASRCALSGKKIKYWDLIPEVFNIDPKIDHTPCPFAEGWYQWMRNLVAARALGQKQSLSSAFVVVYVEGEYPMAKKINKPEWKQLLDAVSGGTVPLRSISYQRLLELAITAATVDDRSILQEFRDWINAKIEEVDNII